MNLKPSITLSLFLILLHFFLTETYAQNNNDAFPRLTADPKALEYFHLGKNDNYSWKDLAQISLWASGDIDSINIDKILSIAEAIENSPALPKNYNEKAEFVLMYMHKNILKSYSLSQTRIDTLLTTGRYNCVSSAVLYTILCKSQGIQAYGVITKDHAFVKVIQGENEIDVETTNAYGFDPGNRKEFHDQFGKATGFTYVPAGNYRGRETIGAAQLISLILNNRIAELEKQRRWAQAVPLAVDRAAFLCGESLAVNENESNDYRFFSEPKRDLLDRLFNYGGTLLRSNKEEDCLQWALTASVLFPSKDRWQELIMASVNNRISRFLRDRKINEAENFLEDNKFHLTEKNYAQIFAVIRSNIAIDYHNRFASAWNKKNFIEAERILDEGLLEFPDDKQLITDKDLVNKQRAN